MPAAVTLSLAVGTGCGLFGGGATPTATPLVPIESGAPTPTSGAGGEPTESVGFIETPAASGSPGESAALPRFACTLPLDGSATISRAQIVDVRVGTHAGFDRVVFEFAAGTPEYDIDATSPPFAHDPSGMPFDVEGSDYLRVTLRGGTKQGETGSTYTGPTEFRPDFPVLAELEEAGDFEAQSTWIIGRRAAGCVRAFVLASPARLVIDLAQP